MDFKQAEKRFRQFKAQFEAGVVTENEFKTQLEKLMIRDEHGNWWMIGYETEQWYRHDGTNWVQTDLPANFSQKSTFVPKWVAIFWVTLGWSMGSAIGIAIGILIGRNVNGMIALASGGAIGGAIGGFVTVISLRVENTLSDWKNMFWIILAWVIGCAIGWASSVEISWTMGGLVTAITLRIENVISDWKSMLWIILAWAIGPVIGRAISTAIYLAVAEDIGWVIGWAIGGAIGGAMGGFVMFWQIRKSRV
ncbi:MAG TPA: hypothetical protein VF918_00650 [Anaerolineales bacterium]